MGVRKHEKILHRLTAQWRKHHYTQEFAKLAGQLAALLESGISLRHSVSYLRRQPGRNARQVLLMTGEKAISNGYRLHESWTSWLSPVAISALDLGDSAGQLATVLRVWSEQYERQRDWLGRVLHTLVYPTLLLTGNLAVLLIVAWVIVPEFRSMYRATGIQLGRQSAFLMTAVHVLPMAILFVLCCAMATFLVTWQEARRDSLVWQRAQKYVPGYSAIRALQTQRLCFFLRILLESGAPVIDALATIESGGVSKSLIRQCRDIRLALLAGEGLSQAFSVDVDPLLPSTLAVAEQTGDLPRALEQTDEYLIRSTARQLETFSKWLEPAMLVLLGAVIGMTMYVLFVPMYDMISALSSAAS